MMAEYIEREAAIKLIEEDKVNITPTLLAIVGTYTAEQAFDGINQTCDRHIESIKELPSADVAPVVHGKWLKDYKMPTCSVCGNALPFEDQYCSNCGAKMDGEENG